MASADGVSYWTEDRARLHQLIREVSPRLAGIYRRCFRLLDEAVNDPDEELARLATAAHCMRELMNRVADVLPDVPARAVAPTVSSGKLSRELAQIADEYPSLFNAGDGDIAAIPSRVLHLVRALVNVARQETATTRERDALIITRGNDLGAPVIAQWTSARDRFVSTAHIGEHVGPSEATKPLPTDADLLEHIAVVEHALRSRLLGFFEARRAVADLLIDINTPEDD
jgi:hypothetical protein